jgi:signal transduction histidine kinase
MNVELQIDAGIELLADRMRLRQVLRNLVSNAVRHGGDNIRVAAAVADEDVICSVIDDGPGVSADVESRLFEKFVHKGSTPLLVGSVGLGLAVAHSVVAGMGGELTYQRIDDETHFVIRLPAPRALAHAAWSGDPFAADAPPVLGLAAAEPLDMSHREPGGLMGGHTRPDI